MILHEIQVPYKYGDTFTLKPIFDVHLGNTYCDKKAFKNFLSDTDEKTFIIGGGDLLDSIITKDVKRYMKHSDNTPTDSIIDDQVNEMVDILMPYKKQIIGLGCLSSDTLVLSEDGWKHWKDLKVDDRVLSLNEKDDIFEYKEIVSIWEYPHDGIMYALKGITQDQLVSPEHSVLRYNTSLTNRGVTEKEHKNRTHGNKKPRIIRNTPDKITKKHKIPTRSFYHNGKETPNPWLVKLIGWIITEGSFNKKKNGNGIYIYQSTKNTSDIQEILECLDELKFEYSVEKKVGRKHRTNESDWVAIYIKKKSAERIRTIINSKSLPREILNNWDFNSLTLLRETMIKGDGHYSIYRNKTRCAYYTADEQLAYDFMELCLKTGKNVSLTKRERRQKYAGYDKYVDTTGYTIAILSDNKKGVSEINKISYKGTIFDLTVKDNHNFVAMRNGKPFITGNSGNHESSINKYCGTHPIRRICEKLETVSLGFSWIVRMRFTENGSRGRTLLIRGHHGWGGGSRTQGADLTKYSKDIAYWPDANILLYGHVHKRQADKIDCVGVCGKRLISKPKHIFICGTYLKTYSNTDEATYSEEKGYPPSSIGGLNIFIKPESNWISISNDL